MSKSTVSQQNWEKLVKKLQKPVATDAELSRMSTEEQEQAFALGRVRHEIWLGLLSTFKPNNIRNSLPDIPDAMLGKLNRLIDKMQTATDDQLPSLDGRVDEGWAGKVNDIFHDYAEEPNHWLNSTHDAFKDAESIVYGYGQLAPREEVIVDGRELFSEIDRYQSRDALMLNYQYVDSYGETKTLPVTINRTDDKFDICFHYGTNGADTPLIEDLTKITNDLYDKLPEYFGEQHLPSKPSVFDTLRKIFGRVGASDDSLTRDKVSFYAYTPPGEYNRDRFDRIDVPHDKNGYRAQHTHATNSGDVFEAVPVNIARAHQKHMTHQRDPSAATTIAPAEARFNYQLEGRHYG